VDSNLLELATIGRCGSSRTTGKPLSVDLLLQATTTEGVSCAFMVGARADRVVRGSRC
jgi:hypothetical protein